MLTLLRHASARNAGDNNARNQLENVYCTFLRSCVEFTMYTAPRMSEIAEAARVTRRSFCQPVRPGWRLPDKSEDDGRSALPPGGIKRVSLLNDASSSEASVPSLQPESLR